MKKVLLFILTVMVLLSVLAVPAFAEEEVTEPTYADTVYDFFSAHSAEVFSALSFLGAVLLAIFHKKGLLPSLNKAIKSLGDSLKAGIDSAKEMSTNTESNLGKFMESIAPTIAKLEGIPELVDKVVEENKKLEVELAKAKNEREVLVQALKSESEMFYELFMASNLPQYQKDNVSAKKAEINHIIEVLENADEVRNT